MKQIGVQLRTIFPGIAVLGVIAWMSEITSRFIGEELMGFAKTPISTVMIALLIGLIVGNLVKIPMIFEKGIQYGSKKLLRFGIVLLGLRLSLLQIGEVALSILPIILICVLVGLFLPHLFNRWLKLPAELVTLISVGTSICGISAIVATSESIPVKKEYTAYAIATITIFGLMSMLVYPFFAHAVFSANSNFAGLFLGTAIHDTSQVTGAAFIYQDYYHDEKVVEIATIAKLIRNTLMVFVIPGISLFSVKYFSAQPAEASGTKKVKLISLFPFFVIGFIIMAALRTVGDQVFQVNSIAIAGFNQNSWKSFVDLLLKLSSIFITMALASVGLKTSISVFKGLGFKPLFVGFITAMVVGATSISLIFLFF